MVFVMPVPAVQYVKKEDVSEFINKRRLMVPIVLLLTTVVFIIMGIFVYPKINTLYNDFGTTKPASITWFPYILAAICAINVCISVYFFINKPDVINIQNKLNKYKLGEMINIKEFSDYKLQLFAFMLVGISVAVLIYSLVVPIYNLTSTVN